MNKTDMKFDINIAAELARLAEAAYSKDQTHDPVGFSASLKGLGYTLVSNIPISDTGTQAYVVKNNEFGVLVFAGTALGTGNNVFADVIADASARLVKGRHEGFEKAFRSVEDRIRTALAKISDLPLYSTGHSLGGALAKVAVLSIPEANWKACYTFGSPPVCDDVSSKANAVPTFLIVNEGDIVSRILDLKEVPELERIFEVGENLIELATEKLGISDSIVKYVQSMRPNLKLYCHFGEVIIFTNSGYILTNETSGSALKRVFKQDPIRIITDHLMARYITNIDAYRSHNILKKPDEPVFTIDWPNKS